MNVDECMEQDTQGGSHVTLYIEQELAISYVSVEADHIGYIQFNFNPDFPQDARALYTAFVNVRSIIVQDA